MLFSLAFAYKENLKFYGPMILPAPESSVFMIYIYLQFL